MKRLPRAACSRLENLTLGSDIRTHEKERGREAKESCQGMILSGRGEERKSSKRADNPARRGNPLFNLINEVASLRSSTRRRLTMAAIYCFELIQCWKLQRGEQVGAKAVRVAIERIFIRLFAVEGDLGIVGYVVTIDTFGFVIKIVFVNSPIVFVSLRDRGRQPSISIFASRALCFSARDIYIRLFIYLFFLFFVRRVHSRDPFFAKNFNQYVLGRTGENEKLSRHGKNVIPRLQFRGGRERGICLIVRVSFQNIGRTNNKRKSIFSLLRFFFQLPSSKLYDAPIFISKRRERFKGCDATRVIYNRQKYFRRAKGNAYTII